MTKEFGVNAGAEVCLTVDELVARLSQFGGTTRLMLRGPEGGFAPLCDLHETPVVLNVNSDPAFGPHDVPWEARPADTSAVVLVSGRWLGI